MKYYLKQIIVTTSGTVADESKYVFDDENTAIIRFHSLMAANMNSENIAICTLMIITDSGEGDLYVSRSETYRKS